MPERPLCVLDGCKEGMEGKIYLNLEGLRHLQAAITQALAGEEPPPFAVYANGSWKWMNLHLATQEQFNFGRRACSCGCQEAFKQIVLDAIATAS
jgi:hypothetical protein